MKSEIAKMYYLTYVTRKFVYASNVPYGYKPTKEEQIEIDKLISDVDMIVGEGVKLKQFLLSYHLSRRSDEGYSMALVSAVNLKQAEEKLRRRTAYHYTDALASELIIAEGIRCLNIE